MRWSRRAASSAAGPPPAMRTFVGMPAMIGALRCRGVRETTRPRCGKPVVSPAVRPDGSSRWRSYVAGMDKPKQLVIAGGGPAAIEAALAVRRLAEERLDITLLSASDAFVYRPLSVSTPFGGGEPLRYSLRDLASERGLRFVRGAVRGVEPSAHRVNVDGAPMTYDALLLALGAAAEEAVPGALTFGGERDVPAVRAALQRLHAGAPLRVAFVAAAETAWTLPLYELALLTARWASQAGLALEPWLVTHEPRALALFGEEASAAVASLLEESGVRLWTGAYPEQVDDGRLWLS